MLRWGGGNDRVRVVPGLLVGGPIYVCVCVCVCAADLIDMPVVGVFNGGAMEIWMALVIFPGYSLSLTLVHTNTS